MAGIPEKYGIVSGSSFSGTSSDVNDDVTEPFN